MGLINKVDLIKEGFITKEGLAEMGAYNRPRKA